MKREREEVNKSKDMAIRVHDLNKVYPSVDGNPANHAVKNVSFGVNYAMCHGILGHNGAGNRFCSNVNLFNKKI